MSHRRQTVRDPESERRLAATRRFGDALLYPPQSAVEFYQHVTDDGLRRTVLEHWCVAARRVAGAGSLW
jgi:hypothetical protein